MKNVTQCMPVINRANSKPHERIINAAQSEKGIEIVTKLFDELTAIFPSMLNMIKSTDELDSIKAQWVVGLKQNGITSTAMLSAGIIIARRQTKPFLPSIGQFCEWCGIGLAEKYGLPTSEQLINLYHRYCEAKGFDGFDEFEFGGDAHYWLIHDLYEADHRDGASRSKINDKAEELIINLVKKLMSGYIIPRPTKTLPETVSKKPLSNEQKLRIITELRKQYRFGYGNTQRTVTASE